MNKFNTTIEKAFTLLKEKGLYGLSFFKLLGLTDNETIKNILEEAQDQGIIELPIALVKNTWGERERENIVFSHGWGNGYVFLDSIHPYYGVHYGEIAVGDTGAVPGGLTYSEWSNKVGEIQWDLNGGKWWVVGFDTNHSFNNANNDKRWVYNHTLNLLIEFYTNLS